MGVKLYYKSAPDRVKSGFLGASKNLKSEICKLQKRHMESFF